MKSFRLELDGPGRGRVYIDGAEVTDVRGGRIEFHVGEPNIVTLEYYANAVNASVPPEGAEYEVTSLGSPAREFKSG